MARWNWKLQIKYPFRRCITRVGLWYTLLYFYNFITVSQTEIETAYKSTVLVHNMSYRVCTATKRCLTKHVTSVSLGSVGRYTMTNENRFRSRTEWAGLALVKKKGQVKTDINMSKTRRYSGTKSHEKCMNFKAFRNLQCRQIIEK